MSRWWWPFGKQDELPPAPNVSHTVLACEFFWMTDTDQLQFFWLLGLADCKQARANARPFRDVTEHLGTFPAPDVDVRLSARDYIIRLKSVIKDGRRFAVVATLQNLFENKALAEKYTGAIEKWKQ
jgi:hypothetical protein